MRVMSVSYLEVYNETCKYLIFPMGLLAVREGPEKGVCVSGGCHCINQSLQKSCWKCCTVGVKIILNIQQMLTNNHLDLILFFKSLCSNLKRILG